MSDYYKNYPHIWKFGTVVTANTTITLWTPTTSTRIILTGLDVNNASGASGSCLITFGNLAGNRIAAYTLESSTSIYPRFYGIESTVVDRTLHAVSSTVPFTVTAYGFEVE